MTGNRLERGECLKCGTPLIFPFNEYRMCTQCIPWLMQALYRHKTAPKNKDKQKVGKLFRKLRFPKGQVGRKAE